MNVSVARADVKSTKVIAMTTNEPRLKCCSKRKIGSFSTNVANHSKSVVYSSGKVSGDMHASSLTVRTQQSRKTSPTKPAHSKA